MAFVGQLELDAGEMAMIEPSIAFPAPTFPGAPFTVTVKVLPSAGEPFTLIDVTLLADADSDL
jgi:hypothetical protein